jgi:uncharacterized membrane protein YheB (UPF0754 family)
MNINTMEPHVLHVLALSRNMNRNVVDEILKFRAEKEISSLKDLERIPSFPQGVIAAWQNLIGFTSLYDNLKIELMDENWNSSRYFDIVFRKSDNRILRWEEM